MGKDRRLFNTKNTEGSSYAGGRILTPYDDNENNVFVFNKSNNQPVYVQEIPRCKFRGVPICLACGSHKNVPKVKALSRLFAEMWKELLDSGVITRY